MTFYKDYENNLFDRMELKYSVYVAALDIQFNNHLPYLWTFCFDMTGEVVFGRNWDDLKKWFEMLETFGYNYDHKLLVYVNDLTQFFTYAKKIIYIDEELLAKRPSDFLVFSSKGLEFRSFQAYTEKDIDKLIYINDVNAENYHIKPLDKGLSDRVALHDAEFEYSSRRVLEMTNTIRRDLDMIYQGIANDIRITKTKRIEGLLAGNLRRSDTDKQLFWHIHAMNPLASDFGRKVVLPQLRKAFFGGTVFYEKGVLNELLENVQSADLVSAYCAEFILSKYPISKYKVLDVPEDYARIFSDAYYNKKALLIQFEAHNVKLKKGALPILPAAMRHYYIDKNNKLEVEEAKKRAQSLKLHESKVIKMCLTDIDFELFCRYYDFDRSSLKVFSILGARTGYLPDYIIKTVAELYSNKMRGKEKLKQLKKAGLDDPLQKELYNDVKSAIARLYGIFTQSPVVTKYIFNQEKKDLQLADANHVMKNTEFRPVVYQWGVVTTALVRKKLCDLRDKFKDHRVKTISGDTDCINFKGNSAKKIIADFNEKINMLVKRRCEAIGIDPADLQDLGTLEVDTYKLYRLTAVKQYAVVRDTDAGEKFETICGGMNTECEYFKHYSSDPRKQIDHFRLGLTIPSADAPRRIVRQCSGEKEIAFTDREGNKIKETIRSYELTIDMKFTLGDYFSSYEGDDPQIDGRADADQVIAATAEMIGHIKTKTPEIRKEKKRK